MCIRDRPRAWHASTKEVCIIPLYVLTSSNDFGPQRCNKSNRKWKSSMSFGDTTYMRVMILSPPVSYTHLDVYKRQLLHNVCHNLLD